MRQPASTPALLEKKELDPWDTPPTGLLAVPGEYTVTLAKQVSAPHSRIGT